MLIVCCFCPEDALRLLNMLTFGWSSSRLAPGVCFPVAAAAAAAAAAPAAAAAVAAAAAATAAGAAGESF